MHRLTLALACPLLLIGLAAIGSADEPPAEAYELAKLHGKVVFLGDVLAEGEGIETVPEARERVLAVKTIDGEYVPLVEDVRGRAFRADERLRDRELVLLVRRYKSHPLAQVIRMFEPKDEALHELDYWCDICSIAMYELKVCDCCQGPIRFRSREVEKRDLPEAMRK